MASEFLCQLTLKEYRYMRSCGSGFSSFRPFDCQICAGQPLEAIKMKDISTSHEDGDLQVPRELCLAWYSLDVFFTASTICHLCTISTDRYFALKNPLKYHGSKRRFSLVGKIVVAWFVPFAIACPLFMFALRLENPAEQSFKGCGPNNVYFITIATVVTFFLPLLIMVVTYVLTVTTIIRQTRKAQKNLYPKSIATLVLRPNLNPYLRSKLLKVTTGGSGKSRSSAATQDASSGNGDCRHTPLIVTASSRTNASPRHLRESRKSLSTPSLVIERPGASLGTSGVSDGECFSFDECGVDERLLATTIRNENVAESSFVEDDDVISSGGFSSTYSPNSSYSPCCYSPLLSDVNTPSPERRRAYLEPPSSRHSSRHSRRINIANNNINGNNNNNNNNGSGGASGMEGSIDTNGVTAPLRRRRQMRREHQRQMSYYNKSKKAVQVLGILFTLFVICYLPFFVVYLIDFFCVSCQNVTSDLVTVFEWIGYSGSMLNPIVYHVFNPTFRQTFHRLMLCHCERTRLMHHTSMRLT